METVSSPLDQKHLWVNLALLLILAQPQLPSGNRGSPTGGLCASPHGLRQASPSLSPTPVQLVSMEPHTAVHSMVLYSRQLHFPGTLLFLGLNTLGERGPSDLPSHRTSLGGGDHLKSRRHIHGATWQETQNRACTFSWLWPTKLLFLLRPALWVYPRLLFPGG